MNTKNRCGAGGPPSLSRIFLTGTRDALPIGLGYFAVAFSLGFTCRSAGVSAVQGFIMSFMNNASAGQYAGLSLIADHATLIEVVFVILVTNARYLLMSCSLSQKFDPDMPLFHRFIIGFDVTDEVFGLAIGHRGYIHPAYMYGVMTFVMPMWASGTSVGIIAGNILPMSVVNALSVAIYGMFLAVIIPPSRENKVVGAFVAISFAVSYVTAHLPMLAGISDSTRIIFCTIILCSIAAILKPVDPETAGGDAAGSAGGDAAGASGAAGETSSAEDAAGETPAPEKGGRHA